MSDTTVSIAKCADYEQIKIDAAIDTAVEPLGGFEAYVSRGDSVLVKPNFLTAADATRHVLTHPVVITSVVQKLLDLGAKPMVGDSPAFGSARKNAEKLGVAEILDKWGVPIVEFKSARKVPNPDGQVYQYLTVDQKAIDADVIINCCKLKAHGQLYVTCAIKNMFGCVSGKRKAWWHFKAGNFQNYFAAMLIETWYLLRPALTIVDAVTAMHRSGPSKGDPIDVGLIVAGTDGVAIDRVVCEIIGADLEKMRTLNAARELDTGVWDMDKINIAGEAIDQVRVSDFEFPDTKPIGFSVPRIAKSTMKQAWILSNESRESREVA